MSNLFLAPVKRSGSWESARLIDTYRAHVLNPKVQGSPDEFRLDDNGAIIQWSQFGEQSEYGWTIDHRLPISKGGTDDIRNLDALHWKNNEAKADNFPTYAVAICTNGSSLFENILIVAPRYTFSPKVIAALLEVYPTNSSLLHCPEVYAESIAMGTPNRIGIVPGT